MVKSTIPFRNVLDALGAIETNAIETSENWDFYRVKYPTPAGFKVATYLSLAHDCPLNEATPRNLAQWKQLSGNTAYTAITTKRSRLALDLRKTAENFRARNATTSRELLFENVVSSLMPHSDRVVQAQYFVEPDVVLSTGERRAAINYMVSELLQSSDSQETVYADVLVAPAGLGKTTVAREIARRILDSKSKSIPVLVESAQWQNLINITLPNILNAALLHLVPDGGHLTNSKLFQLLVQEQLLVPIFDGFDELCLHPQSSYTPTRLLDDLLDLVGNTGAKILITTRETFWETYGSGSGSPRIKRLDLQGFSNEQRKRFFEKRLSLPEERDIANRLAREIGERLYEGAIERAPHQSDRASGMPLMLELVALYVEGNPEATFAPQSKDPLGPLLEAVCERETVRQQLPISAQRQMRIFEELFVDFNEDIPRGDLALYVLDTAPETTQDEIARFESHAFFSPGSDLRPRFENLRIYFIARWLANRLEAALSEQIMPSQIARQLEKNATGNTNVFDFLVDRFNRMGTQQAVAAISHAWAMAQSGTRLAGPLSALFHLAQRIARDAEKNSRRERTEYLQRLLGVSEIIRKLSVTGQISGLDFSGSVFQEAHLRDVEFQNCVFNEKTTFIRARFEGELRFENCTHAGRVSLVDCELSEEAENAWNIQAGRASKRIINESTVRSALRDVLRKFLGPFGFSSIKEADSKTGPVSRSPCRDEVWDELFREKVVARHKISGVSEGGINVSESTEIRHEIRNFMDNAALGPRLKRVTEGVLKALSDMELLGFSALLPRCDLVSASEGLEAAELARLARLASEETANVHMYEAGHRTADFGRLPR